MRLLSGRTGRWEERRREGEEPSIAQARELVDWIEGRVEHRGESRERHGGGRDYHGYL